MHMGKTPWEVWNYITEEPRTFQKVEPQNIHTNPSPEPSKEARPPKHDLGLLVFRSERELVPNVLSHPISGTYLQQLRDLILQRSDHFTLLI